MVKKTFVLSWSTNSSKTISVNSKRVKIASVKFPCSLDSNDKEYLKWTWKESKEYLNWHKYGHKMEQMTYFLYTQIQKVFKNDPNSTYLAVFWS